MYSFGEARKLDQEDSMIEKFISPGDKLEMKSTTDVKLPDGSDRPSCNKVF